MPSIARLNQHVAALLASTAGFAAGVTLGWNSLAGLALRTALGWDQEDADLVVSVVAVGATLGALFLVLLPQKCRAGSSGAFVCAAVPPLVLGWTVICYGDYSYWYLLWGRIFCGLGLGSLCTLVPLYIGEIAADGKQRDALLFYFHMMVSGGLACSFALASAILLEDEDELPLKRYSMGCAAACVPALLCCAVPESPLQRVHHQESQDTINTLQSIDSSSTEDELMYSLARAFDEKKVSALRSWKFWHRFGATMIVTALQQLSGASPIIFNALALFDHAGSGKLTSGQLNLVCGALQITASMLAVVLVTYLGRRRLLIGSSFLMGLSLILLGSYIRSRDSNTQPSSTYNWMPPTWIALYFGAYSLGVGPVSWALLADSFPMQLRAYSASIVSAVSWLLCLTLNHQLRALLMKLGLAETLWLFAGFCWLGALLGHFLVRETNAKTLAELHANFRTS
ncbi:facilitated trehalose transporter Tret1-like [Copidosoma floridanum]|uniref:facilitated trehalose transporter Tret1-like n=1 Tax=Copidosoma floridanum TaxID=29053 RepID=UPI0006C981AF|nr:facilitated trehalose transporter Tret1-like [Copidosoma floridanum]